MVNLTLKKCLLPLAAAAALSMWSCGHPASGGRMPVGPEEQQLFIGDSIAVANTSCGKVRGYILRGIYTYLGIPYAAPASGENRFMPPQKPEPWEGIRPAVFYGNAAPQRVDGKYTNSYSTFSDHWNYYDVSEDCLTLNVWTPGTDDGKRPVLFWIHGGGFTSGNSIEQDSYNGENFSRYGDVVFVSVNHRLGPIGFSDFSAVDERFSDSGNVGILDIVAALEWVHENIAEFGGDPGNVTVMGQSGGGAKVCTLVSMAETDGLISKAVALSGNITGAIDAGYSRDLGKYIYEKAGRSMKKLQEMPWEEYLDLADEAAAEFSKTRSNGMMRGSFGPVGDGLHVPMGTFFSDKNLHSNNIPMIFSTTTCEFSISKTDAALENISRDEAVRLLEDRGIENAAEVYDAYSGIFPGQKPVDVVGLVQSSRAQALAAADAKCMQDAPVYLAWFGFNPPLFDGRMRATHCSDICYWFMNTDLMLTHTGGGAAPRALSVKMADALLRFMRTGDPNGEGLPEWPAYNTEEGATMFLGEDCRVTYSPDREGLALLAR